MTPPLSRKWLSLLIGVDALMILAVTLIGFAMHERSLSGGRWLSTFLPLSASWAGIAIPLGMYKYEITRQPRQIWRVLLAALFAGPLAALLRALWVPGIIIPVFAWVLVATTAAGMGVWRLILALATARKA